MRVSVIVAMPAGDMLREAGRMAFAPNFGVGGAQQRPPAPLMLESLSYDVAPKAKKAGLQLDPSFPPLPLSARRPEGVDLAMAGVSEAPTFLTRGTIEADKIDDVRSESSKIQIFSDPEIGLYAAAYCGVAPVGSTVDVERELNVTALQKKRLTGSKVAVAIMDNGVNLARLRAAGLSPRVDRSVFWAPPGVPAMPFGYPADHGTMCAYDALIAAPRCTLLDFPILRSTTPGGSAMAGFLSDALLAYSYLLTQFANPTWPYKALVVNNSWGMYHPSWDFPAGHPGRYADNPRHPFNIIVSTLARAGADILFAAGNCGANCPDGRCGGVTAHTITGANAHPDVLTLAGCDTRGDRVGYSSQGPAIPGMASNKPDVAAYTHFLGSEAFGPGTADSGTSTSCPVAAGCVAAIRTRLAPGMATPKDLFDQIKAHAAPPPGGAPGWSGDYGFGIMDPLAVATHYGL